MRFVPNAVGRAECGILGLAGGPTMDGSKRAEMVVGPLHEGAKS